MQEGTPSALENLLDAVAGDPRDRLRDPLERERAIRLHGDGVAHVGAQLGEIAPALLAHPQLVLDAVALRDLLLQLGNRGLKLGGSPLHPRLELLVGPPEDRIELHAPGDVARVHPIRTAPPDRYTPLLVSTHRQSPSR
jgi:hypothetical protein